jgi:hypothetical protein
MGGQSSSVRGKASRPSSLLHFTDNDLVTTIGSALRRLVRILARRGPHAGEIDDERDGTCVHSSLLSRLPERVEGVRHALGLARWILKAVTEPPRAAVAQVANPLICGAGLTRRKLYKTP